MRQYKFRGKTPKGRWVYGNLVNGNDGVFIVPDGCDVEFQEPQYHSDGVGCGVEDRGINSRYEAAAYGFQEGVDRCAELYHETYEVIQETIGQFIELDSVPLFEGDVCKSGPNTGVIEFNVATLCYILRRENKTFIRLDVIKESIKVVGNVHDDIKTTS